MLISLIVPCYNEEEAMPLFYKEASRVAAEMKTSHGADFEFIFVDDGSRDGTLRVARELHAQDPRVRYVSFSRNFGKEAGIYAGLQAAKGDYVATMDADLQDPPASRRCAAGLPANSTRSSTRCPIRKLSTVRVISA